MSNQNTEVVVTKLKNVPESISISDLGYDFYYKRILNPANVLSDGFNLFYKNSQDPNWITFRGVLTNDYSIVRTEEAVRQIQSNLNARIERERHYRSGTSVKCSFLLSDYEINVEEDSDSDKLIFKLITNITADINIVTQAKLSFNIINGFSGAHALQLNYGVLKKITYGQQSIELNNVFILDEYTKRLIHDDRMSLSYQDLSDVQRQIQNKINLFKTTEINDHFLKEFEKSFPRKFVKKFVALYEPLTNEFKNFYYCSYIWSALLESEKRIPMEIKLRAFISNFLSELRRREVQS